MNMTREMLEELELYVQKREGLSDMLGGTVHSIHLADQRRDVGLTVDHLKALLPLARVAVHGVAEAKPKTEVYRGDRLRLKGYGEVIFDRLDEYMGQTTARLQGITHPGTYHPFVDEVERQGFQLFDRPRKV